MSDQQDVGSLIILEGQRVLLHDVAKLSIVLDGLQHNPASVTGGFQIGVDLSYSTQQVIAAPILCRRSRPAASDECNQLPADRYFHLDLNRNLDLNLNHSRDLYLNCLSRRTRGDHEACEHEKPGQGQPFFL